MCFSAKKHMDFFSLLPSVLQQKCYTTHMCFNAKKHMDFFLFFPPFCNGSGSTCSSLTLRSLTRTRSVADLATVASHPPPLL